jgi:GAF domain-containing protein
VPEDTRRPDISVTLSQMAGLVLSEETVDAVLQLLVSLAVSGIPGVDAASVSVVRTGQFETSNATSEEVRAVDEQQYRKGQGPCVETIRQGRRHNVAVAQEEQRWPDFAAAAREAGYARTLSVPLRARDRTIGALNLYARSESGFGEDEVEQAELFADHAAAVLANAIELTTAEKVNQQLQEALSTREVIGKAQGILMVRRGATSEGAFDMLRRASQRSNRKLREIAGEIVEREERQGRRV